MKMLKKQEKDRGLYRETILSDSSAQQIAPRCRALKSLTISVTNSNPMLIRKSTRRSPARVRERKTRRSGSRHREAQS